MSSALSQTKIPIPFLEIVNIIEYGKEVLDLLSKENKEDNSQKDNDALVIYLGTNINENSPHVDTFYLTILINNKLLRSYMVTHRATVNCMHVDVMKVLGLNVDTPYGKCHAMEN